MSTENRLAVRDEVMRDEEQDGFGRSDLVQANPQQWRTLKVEWLAGGGARAQLRLSSAKGRRNPVQVIAREVHSRRAADDDAGRAAIDLHRHA